MAVFTFGEVRDACGGEFNRETDLTQRVEEVVTDTRITAVRSLFIALEGERFDAHDFLPEAVRQGAILLLVNRKKSHKVPPEVTALLVEDTLKAYQDLAKFHRKRFPDLTLVGLTGSYGKTSTKEILRSIFIQAAGKEHVLATEGNKNNQIGVPQTLLNLTADHQYAVVEMGTNHFGEIAPLAQCALPQASLIVSIGNCHLEFLKDLDGVASEKSSIYLPSSVRIAVYPGETAQRKILSEAAEHIPETGTFGKTDSADVRAVYHGGDLYGSSFDLIRTKDGKKVTVKWSLAGEHQAVNCAGAAALALLLGIDLETIAEGASHVSLPGQRMRRTKHADSFWINDSYNANPDSMRASLRWLAEFASPEKLLLVLGDMGELGKDSPEGHKAVLSFAAEHFPGSRIVAVGRKMEEASLLLEKESGEKERFIKTPSAAEGVDFVRSLVRKGDLVFLKGSNSTNLGIIEPPGDEAACIDNIAMMLEVYLKALLPVTASVSGRTDLLITGVTQRGDTVKPGQIFCAIRGAKADGHDFLDQAVANGAVCCVVGEESQWIPPGKDFPLIRVKDSYAAWGLLCETFMRKPSHSLQVLSVTGTNGKTTVTYLLRHILRSAFPEKKCGLITTVEYDNASGILPEEGVRTTPEAMDLQKLFAEMKENHCTYAVMEQSSHGLHQHRAGSLLCAGAVFTNLTGDHLDYHGDMEHYFQAKKILFTQMLTSGAPAVINVDDPYGERLWNELRSEQKNVCGITLCGKAGAESSVEEIRMTLSGSGFILRYQGEKIPFRIPLSGGYNIYNAAEAIVLALHLGITPQTVQKAMEELRQGPPGRLEKFALPGGGYAFVDYAHTDDALRQVLKTLRELSPGKLLCVFGCGGDRDRTKRPRMASAAAEYSDQVILTSDNPRSEEALSILQEIVPGFPPGYAFLLEPDRKKAIEKALSLAGDQDLVLIAGKGHERYQEINGVKHHFDDREEVLAFIQKYQQNQ